MKRNLAFHHVSLYVKDYDSSLKLYQALGFSPYCHWIWKEDVDIYKKDGRNCFLTLEDGTFIELHEVPSEYGKGPIGHFCLHAKDVDEVYKTALENAL